MGYSVQPPRSRYAPSPPKNSAAIAGAVCAGLAALGAVLPWVTLSTPEYSVHASGTKFTEGVLSLIFGVVTIGCFIGAFVAAADSRKLLGIFALVGAAATAICPIVLLIRTSGLGFQGVQIGPASIGWGLGFYLCILAGLASVVTAFIAMSASGRPPRRSLVPRTRRPLPARSGRPIARDRSRRRY